LRLFTLHGWSFDKGVWRGTPFEKGIHLELPGHGSSKFQSSDILSLAHEIAGLLPESSSLIGWSLGASVFLLIALLHPEKVKELYLFSPTAKFSGISQNEIVVKRFLKKLRRNFEKTVYEFRELCSPSSYPIPKLEAQKSTELLESFCNLDLTEVAGEISVPVEIFVGERDSVTGIEGAYSLFRELKRARMTIIPSADHLTVLRKFSF